MEDAVTAILDFRDNLNEEVAAQAPDVSSFFAVNTSPFTQIVARILKAAQSALVLLSYMQVFDGHSGPDAANYAKDHLHAFFAGHLEADHLLATEMQEAMVSVLMCCCYPAMLGTSAEIHFCCQVQAFIRTDLELYRAYQAPISETSHVCSGTTALTAFIWGDQLMVANAGDCRAVLCRRGKTIVLSNDHRHSNPEEALRVRAAGGYICPEGYLNGHLAVLRALGDHHFTDLKAPTGPNSAMQGPLTAEPEIASHTLLPEDEFILMACDGFWDVFDSQRAVECARQQLREHNDPQLCSQHLVWPCNNSMYYPE